MCASWTVDDEVGIGLLKLSPHWQPAEYAAVKAEINAAGWVIMPAVQWWQHLDGDTYFQLRAAAPPA